MRLIQNILIQIFLLIGLCMSATVHAQSSDGKWLDVQKGKSLVLQMPKDVINVSLTDDAIAYIQYVAELDIIMLQGKKVGTTDLIVNTKKGPDIFEVTVHQDLSGLIRRIDAIVEGEPPQIYPLKGRIVVEGVIDDLNTLEQVAMVAEIYDSDFVNLMTVRGDHQVQLEVVFAEVSRTGLRELGVNFWGQPPGTFQGRVVGPASSTGMQGANALSPLDASGNPLVPSPSAAGFKIIAGLTDLFHVYISILDDYKLAKVLAQPTVVALSGQKGEFLAGGEVPIPSSAGQGAVQIEFKEYGMGLSFVPTVLAGDVIDLQVETEVSEPDFSIASRLTGVEVPGFATRKTSTHVRVDSGMTFALAGLLLEETQYSKAKLPILGDIPIIGSIFRYVRHQRVEKELIIFVTPRLVRPLAPGEMPAPPGTTEDNNPGDFAFFLLGMQRRPGSRTAKPTATIGLDR